MSTVQGAFPPFPWLEDTVSQSFLGLGPEHAAWSGAAVALLPVPYDLTTSFQPGARRGPEAVLAASRHVELYDEELDEEPYRCGICTLPPLETDVRGPEAMSERVAQAASDLFQSEKFPIFLGGDHAITHGVIRALAARGERFSVVQLDAHADLRDRYQGSPWSHACVGRRIVEAGGRLVQIGVRSLSAEEAAFLRESERVTTVFAHELWAEAGAWRAALEGLEEPVYLTVDVDAFDPALMPATGTPEPGGLDWPTALTIVKTLCARTALVGADVVELAPVPGLVGPDVLVARFLYKLIGYRQHASGAERRRV